MIKKEDLQRHPEDNRVVIINSMEDFNLWEKRKELGFKALLLPKAFSEEECGFISKDIVSVFAQNEYSVLKADKGPKLKSDRSNLEAVLTNENFQNLTRQRILKCFDSLASAQDKACASTYIRKSASYPELPHTHDTTLGIVFSGNATQFVKPSYTFSEQETQERNAHSMPKQEHIYEINAGDLIIFEDIWHFAGKLSGKKEESRTQLVMF